MRERGRISEMISTRTDGMNRFGGVVQNPPLGNKDSGGFSGGVFLSEGRLVRKHLFSDQSSIKCRKYEMSVSYPSKIEVNAKMDSHMSRYGSCPSTVHLIDKESH